MKELLSSTRFWAFVLICICGTVMACLHVLPAEQVYAGMSGMLGGFGVAKVLPGSSSPAASGGAAGGNSAGPAGGGQ